jgi:hypothetical protein
LIGCRRYLAARYGLRSSELVRLTLDNIDWRADTLNVFQTKTRQELQLPITDEAGDILIRYLQTARPPSSHRELFLRRRAPSGPLDHTAVHDILNCRIRQSGLELPTLGGHVLRHSFAVHLLRQGVPMIAIGDALGHRDPQSTAVYLRLAIDDLRTVGLSVPSGGKPLWMRSIGIGDFLGRGRRLGNTWPTPDFAAAWPHRCGTIWNIGGRWVGATLWKKACSAAGTIFSAVDIPGSLKFPRRCFKAGRRPCLSFTPRFVAIACVWFATSCFSTRASIPRLTFMTLGSALHLSG